MLINQSISNQGEDVHSHNFTAINTTALQPLNHRCYMQLFSGMKSLFWLAFVVMLSLSQASVQPSQESINHCLRAAVNGLQTYTESHTLNYSELRDSNRLTVSLPNKQDGIRFFFSQHSLHVSHLETVKSEVKVIFEYKIENIVGDINRSSIQQAVCDFTFHVGSIHQYPVLILTFENLFRCNSMHYEIYVQRRTIKIPYCWYLKQDSVIELLQWLDGCTRIQRYKSVTLNALSISEFELDNIKVATVFNHVIGLGLIQRRDKQWTFQIVDTKIKITRDGIMLAEQNTDKNEIVLDAFSIPLQSIIPIMYQRDRNDSWYSFEHAQGYVSDDIYNVPEIVKEGRFDEPDGGK